MVFDKKTSFIDVARYCKIARKNNYNCFTSNKYESPKYISRNKAKKIVYKLKNGKSVINCDFSIKVRNDIKKGII